MGRFVFNSGWHARSQRRLSIRHGNRVYCLDKVCLAGPVHWLHSRSPWCQRRRVVKVLKLSAQGLPQSWITLEQAALHYAADDVRWESGGEVACFRGGHNAVTGCQSVIHINSIIGTRGAPSINPHSLQPGLTNGKLFARDRCICAYCGRVFHENDLTREHIVPISAGGGHHWMNLVTACRSCNHRKGARTPEQARMPLLYTPYVPSLWEDFILRNRRILADQMEFLLLHVPRSSRWARDSLVGDGGAPTHEVAWA